MVAVTALFAIKVVIVAAVALFHFFQGKHLKGVILAVLIFLGIPDVSDMLVQPLVANFLGLPLLLSAILYFGIIWLLIFLVWKFFPDV